MFNRTFNIIKKISKTKIKQIGQKRRSAPGFKKQEVDVSGDFKSYEKCYEKFINKDFCSSFETMGLFGTHDELLCYYYDFKELTPRAYFFPATHRPAEESFESIKLTIAEFLGGVHLNR